jgi:predicted RND superfamily exporter protein
MRPQLPWPVRRPTLVLLIAAALSLVAGALATGLSVRADVALLLPVGAKSVADLEAVQARAQTFGNLLVAIDAPDAAAREAAARRLLPALQALDPSLVRRVVADSAAVRQHVWRNRYLFVPLDKLQDAYDGLRRQVAKANPLFVDLGAESDAAASDRLNELRDRLDEAQRRAEGPSPLLSRDGRMQLFVVQATFSSTAVSESRRLVSAVHHVLAQVQHQIPPGVKLGATGDIVTVVIEHDAIMRGMARASLITAVVVLAGMMLFFRSAAAVAVIGAAITVGTLATFAMARLTIGYLNLATAFLIPIIIGNGINFPILIVGRYLEERRRDTPHDQALGCAWSGTRRGTFAAALTASVAYGSLIVTDFRGFRHFGVVAGLGMLLCLAAAYLVAPAALALLARRGHFDKPRPEPHIGAWLERHLPPAGPRSAWALGLVAMLAGVFALRYIVSDPFEYDLREVRSSSPEARTARAWQARLDQAFGRGIAGGFVFAVDRREDARALVAKLRPLSEGPGAVLARVSSLDDLVPPDQDEKLALLARIRTLIDRNADKMSPKDRADALRLRPPEGLGPLTDADVPADLAVQFTEKDGTRGRLIFANNSGAVNAWDGRQLDALADRLRALSLPPGIHIAGNAFVFADMVRVIRSDGPQATLLALFGVLVMIGLTVGVDRHGVVTAACVTLGTLGMLALADVVRLRINFLDFVALPLTLGIGTDYAANVLSRARQEAQPGLGGGGRLALRSMGSVVVLCSFTTVVGYCSLLISDNAGIRSFGTAAVLGELTCIASGLLAGPTLLELIERRRRARAGLQSAPRAEQPGDDHAAAGHR